MPGCPAPTSACGRPAAVRNLGGADLGGRSLFNLVLADYRVTCVSRKRRFELKVKKQVRINGVTLVKVSSPACLSPSHLAPLSLFKTG